MKDEILWKMGDTEEYGFFIKSGSFAFMENKDGSNMSFEEGTFIGEADVFINQTFLTTTVKCLEKGKILKIKFADLAAFFIKYPNIQLFFSKAKYIL